MLALSMLPIEQMTKFLMSDKQNEPIYRAYNQVEYGDKQQVMTKRKGAYIPFHQTTHIPQQDLKLCIASD